MEVMDSTLNFDRSQQMDTLHSLSDHYHVLSLSGVCKFCYAISEELHALVCGFYTVVGSSCTTNAIGYIRTNAVTLWLC